MLKVINELSLRGKIFSFAITDSVPDETEIQLLKDSEVSLLLVCKRDAGWKFILDAGEAAEKAGVLVALRDRPYTPGIAHKVEEEETEWVREMRHDIKAIAKKCFTKRYLDYVLREVAKERNSATG